MSVDVSAWLLSLHASTARKNRVSDKIHHLNIPASVVILLQMAPTAASVSGMRNSHGVPCERLSVNSRGGLSSIFMSLSGIGDATKCDDPPGDKNLREVSLMTLNRIYE